MFAIWAKNKILLIFLSVTNIMEHCAVFHEFNTNNLVVLSAQIAYPFFRVFILALEGVHFGNPIALDSPWKKGYEFW